MAPVLQAFDADSNAVTLGAESVVLQGPQSYQYYVPMFLR